MEPTKMIQKISAVTACPLVCTDEARGSQNESCCICLEEMIKNNDRCKTSLASICHTLSRYTSFGNQHRLIRLACSHEFHRGCFLKWYKKQGTCPLCRTYTNICNHIFIECCSLCVDHCNTVFKKWAIALYIARPESLNQKTRSTTNMKAFHFETNLLLLV